MTFRWEKKCSKEDSMAGCDGEFIFSIVCEFLGLNLAALRVAVCFYHKTFDRWMAKPLKHKSPQ